MDRLVRFGLVSTNVCYLCEAGPENHDHIFCTCPFVVGITHCIMVVLGLHVHCYSLSQWIDVFAQSHMQNSLVFKIRAAALGCIFNTIWQGRNAMCFQKHKLDLRVV